MRRQAGRGIRSQSKVRSRLTAGGDGIRTAGPTPESVDVFASRLSRGGVTRDHRLPSWVIWQV